jgi:hypothetical protein
MNRRPAPEPDETVESYPGLRLPMMLGAAIAAGIGLWRLGEVLSPDAIGMAVGILFGMLAGIPAALILLYAIRQNERKTERDEYDEPRRQLPQHGQPPVIVVTTPVPQQMMQPPGAPQHGQWPPSFVQPYGNNSYGNGGYGRYEATGDWNNGSRDWQMQVVGESAEAEPRPVAVRSRRPAS